MLILVMLRLFLAHCLVCCIKNSIQCIVFILINSYKNTLYKYGGKDVEKDLRSNCVFNHANACMKSLHY